MALSDANVHKAVRGAIRRTLFLRGLSEDEYTAMTIKKLRAELKDALGEEISNESERLIFLNVSLRRLCRKQGWSVQVPASSWYKKQENQKKKAPTIANFVISKPMKEI